MKGKVTLDLDKRAWHPSPLVGQVVLITTLNEDGTSNVAPKSWISMMAFEPPILALGCNREHWSARNILAWLLIPRRSSRAVSLSPANAPFASLSSDKPFTSVWSW